TASHRGYHGHGRVSRGTAKARYDRCWLQKPRLAHVVEWALAGHSSRHGHQAQAVALSIGPGELRDLFPAKLEFVYAQFLDAEFQGGMRQAEPLGCSVRA